jgi:hypothetical protein
MTIADSLDGRILYRPMDETIDVSIAGSNLTGAVLYFRIKKSFSDSDADALINKSSNSGGGITIASNSGSAIVASIAIEPDDYDAIDNTSLATVAYTLFLEDATGKSLHVVSGEGLKIKRTAFRSLPG